MTARKRTILYYNARLSVRAKSTTFHELEFEILLLKFIFFRSYFLLSASIFLFFKGKNKKDFHFNQG
ncbi:hypothetical protein B0A67_21245 [Flavobacterium aquidurense]|nr:hypothetical protein B0A67_21245 [Flavobacterium aquidurense]